MCKYFCAFAKFAQFNCGKSIKTKFTNLWLFFFILSLVFFFDIFYYYCSPCSCVLACDQCAPKMFAELPFTSHFYRFMNCFQFPQINFTPEQSVQSIKKLYRLYYISSPDFLWKFHCKKSINCLKQTRNGDKWGGEEVGLDPAPSEVWFLPFGALFALGQSAVINVSIEVGGARWLREQEGGRSW